MSLHWRKCAVIGAAGKMGRGIALILLLEMAVSDAKDTGGIGKSDYRLVLIDVNQEAVDSLKDYLKIHLQKQAEKQINKLREFYKLNSALVSNRDIINDFVERGMHIVYCSTSISAASDIPIIFEAILEDVETKCKLYKDINTLHASSPYFLTNTSSIPIHLLNSKADLKGRIIGFHLYNPPAVQKLLEIIPLENGDPELYQLALKVGQSLGKKIVIAKDVAGFIGNGHFLRDIIYACDLVKKLRQEYSFGESIYIVNRISGEYLLRPMGIFQLIDYVGLDVIQNVGGIMNAHIPENHYEDSVLQPLLQAGHRGGQNPDGSQKDGFFKYSGHHLTGVYEADQKHYIDLVDAQWKIKCDEVLGTLPKDYISWSVLSKDVDNKEKIENYLKNLAEDKGMGSKLACDFLLHSRAIVNQLADSKVAASKEDVITVLKNGFFHLYG